MLAGARDRLRGQKNLYMTTQLFANATFVNDTPPLSPLDRGDDVEAPLSKGDLGGCKQRMR